MKTFLVTGASSGIGAAVSKYLAGCGYRVVMVARSAQKLKETAKEMVNEPILIPFDLTKFDEYDVIFDVCKEQGIKFDGFIHCAGVGTSMPVKRIRIQEDMESQMEINAYAFAQLGRYFGSKRYSNDGGSIVAISSIAAHSCVPGHCGYAASKAALDAIVQVMSKEFSKRKIRVNAILPSFVDTPLLRGDLEKIYDLQGRIEVNQPFGIIDPRYLAYLVEFLISDKAKYITGTLIPVTAGGN